MQVKILDIALAGRLEASNPPVSMSVATWLAQQG